MTCGVPVTGAQLGVAADEGFILALVLPGGSVSAVPEQAASSRAPASAAAGRADRAAGPVRVPGVARGRGEAEGRGARGGRIGFDIVQSSLFGAKALPGVRSRSSTERTKALSSG
ncbi:hypothetical protein Scani_13290 [Streptomyces caniferus]|uniref:Uncharacterized protein n=1 Tax=Streptomyces caniferus TaxID=285557 RepID=A0A640S3S2_9ACTN|nr:hypothetical protein Scani_13290 [Streptomyces caniferus]